MPIGRAIKKKGRSRIKMRLPFHITGRRELAGEHQHRRVLPLVTMEQVVGRGRIIPGKKPRSTPVLY